MASSGDDQAPSEAAKADAEPAPVQPLIEITLSFPGHTPYCMQSLQLVVLRNVGKQELQAEVLRMIEHTWGTSPRAVSFFGPNSEELQWPLSIYPEDFWAEFIIDVAVDDQD